MVVFDLDDTLYKEHNYVLSGYNAVARQIALITGKDRQKTLAEILSSNDAMATASRLSGMPVEGWVELYRNHFPCIALDPSALHLLNELKQRGVPMAMITDRRSVGQRNKYIALGLDRFIHSDRLMISEETGAEKNSPLAFQKLMDSFPHEKSWTYIGDNHAKDFLHPNALGWTTIMLRDNYNENIHPQTLPPSEAYHPQHTVISLPRALDIIPDTK